MADIPTPREHLGRGFGRRYLYAVGGRELSADKNSTALERYDPADDSWKTLDDMPDDVGSVGAAYVDGLVIAGGESVTDALDAVQAFDVESKRWSQLPALRRAPRGRRGRARGFALRDRRRRRRRPRPGDGHGERARLRLRRSRAAYSAARFGARVEPVPCT